MRSTVQKTHAFLLLAAFFFFASTQSATGQEGQWPEWLSEAMAKEAGRFTRTRKLTVGDGFFKSRLIGKQVGDPQQMEGGWYVSTDIGADTPLECWIFQDAVDPAATLANIADASMDAAAAASGGDIGERNIFLLDAGAYNAAPYLALEWMYSVGTAPNVAVGLAKRRPLDQ